MDLFDMHPEALVTYGKLTAVGVAPYNHLLSLRVLVIVLADQHVREECKLVFLHLWLHHFAQPSASEDLNDLVVEDDPRVGHVDLLTRRDHRNLLHLLHVLQ